ncbi:hypothetical protein GCM10023201_14990 [Actinomycetospora corticicola]
MLAGFAAVEYSDASGDWQEAIRQETSRASAVQEEARAVYVDEAPEAFRIASARVRANELRAIAPSSRLAASELVIANQIVFARSRVAPPDTLSAGNRYLLSSGEYDVARRISDATKQIALMPDPDSTFAAGDRHAATARWISGVTVLLTGLAMAAASVRRRPRPRPAGGDEPEIIPQPGVADHRRRNTMVVLLVLWAAGVLLPFAQLALGGEEQRYQAIAAKTAAEIAGEIATSQARTGFDTDAQKDAVVAQLVAVAREIAALEATTPESEAERLTAGAEERAAVAIGRIAVQMGRPLTEQEGVDPLISKALTSTAEDWGADAAVQSSAADRAETFGAWSNRAVAMIAALAAVSAILEIAEVRPRRP